jgi:hypothetical protein
MVHLGPPTLAIQLKAHAVTVDVDWETISFPRSGKDVILTRKLSSRSFFRPILLQYIVRWSKNTEYKGKQVEQEGSYWSENWQDTHACTYYRGKLTLRRLPSTLKYQGFFDGYTTKVVRGMQAQSGNPSRQ